MNYDEHTVPTGGQHYSGRNRIPNIHEFVAQLDKEKRERDAAIEAEDKEHARIAKEAARQQQQNGNTTQQQQQQNLQDTKEHVPEKSKGARKKTKTVRDPVTGKDVEIENPKENFKDVVENPHVRSSHKSFVSRGHQVPARSRTITNTTIDRYPSPTRTSERTLQSPRPLTSLARSTDGPKMSRHRPTRSSPEAPQTCPSTARRPM